MTTPTPADVARSIQTTHASDGVARIAHVYAGGRIVDGDYDRRELVLAAGCHVGDLVGQVLGDAPDAHTGSVPKAWPWRPETYQPSADPIDVLARAGAFCAAEIDRLIAERAAGGAR